MKSSRSLKTLSTKKEKKKTRSHIIQNRVSSVSDKNKIDSPKSLKVDDSICPKKHLKERESKTYNTINLIEDILELENCMSNITKYPMPRSNKKEIAHHVDNDPINLNSKHEKEEIELKITEQSSETKVCPTEFTLKSQTVSRKLKQRNNSGNRTLINIGFKVENSEKTETQDQVNLVTILKDESETVKPKENENFSKSDLPLTGDEEVDEEIIKFYKARFNRLRRQENAHMIRKDLLRENLKHCETL